MAAPATCSTNAPIRAAPAKTVRPRASRHRLQYGRLSFTWYARLVARITAPAPLLATQMLPMTPREKRAGSAAP